MNWELKQRIQDAHQVVSLYYHNWGYALANNPHFEICDFEREHYNKAKARLDELIQKAMVEEA